MAYLNATSSAHDSGFLLAWVVQREGEKPAGRRAIWLQKAGKRLSGNLARMSEDKGQLCLTEFSLTGMGDVWNRLTREALHATLEG